MTRRLLSGLLLGLTLVAPRAYAGEPGPGKVRPGGVATTVVTFSAPAAGAAGRFSIEPAAGVRILGATTGLLPETGGATRRLPVTFAVPADASAGVLVGGSISLEWADGRTERQELRVEVDVVHKLALTASASQPTVQPGGVVRVRYRLENLGNAVDTAHIVPETGAPWIASPASDSRVIPAGASVEGSFEIKAPRTAPLGEQRLVQVRAVGRGGEQKASLVLLVTEANGSLLGLAQVPVHVFVGSSTAGGANLSISGRGSIGPATEVGIDLRRLGSFESQTYGRTDLWGPRALLSLRHGALQAELGDLSLRNEGLLSGSMGAGSGVQVRRQGTGWSGGVVLARPQMGLDGRQSGHLLQGDLGHSFAGGILMARVADFSRGAANPFGAGRLQAAGLGYELSGTGPHRFKAEAGFVRQDVGGLQETQGASIDATYAFSTPGVSVSAHLRRSPDQLSGTTLVGNEASVSGSAAVLSFVRLHGSAYQSDRTRSGGQGTDETQGASTGIQLYGLGSSLGLTWNTRQYQGAFTLGGREQRNSLSTSLNTALGPLSLLALAEAGVVARGDAEPSDVRRLQGQLRWARPSKSAWVSVNYTDEALFRSPLQAEAGAQLRLGELNLDAALGASLLDGPQVSYLHAGSEIYVSRALSLIAGAEYRPWSASGSPWTFSFGVRRALSLPLPLPQASPVSGVVFEDRNGNGRQDRGEPGLERVAVSIGSLKTVTGAKGRFAFRHAVPAGLPVQMDVGSLGEGYLALFSETLVPGSGRIEMPVVRASALELTMFADHDGDQSRQAAEPPLSGAVVVLKAPTGRSYPRTLDAGGSTTFSALPPGAYEAYLLRDGQEILAARIELAPGELAAREIGVETQGRQVKMWNGSAAPVQR